jgi:hypothetical protein
MSAAVTFQITLIVFILNFSLRKIIGVFVNYMGLRTFSKETVWAMVAIFAAQFLNLSSVLILTDTAIIKKRMTGFGNFDMRSQTDDLNL